jgi:uncharacterized protein
VPSAILDNRTSLDHIRLVITDDVTYVSLNCDNPDLHGIMPWYGTHKHAGPESIVKTFVDVGRYRRVIAFEPEAVFGVDEHPAMFGRFT